MERNHKFDNVKALLIFLVVFGHSLEYLYGVKGSYGAIRAAIYSFHMPAFVFISGYFARKSKRAVQEVVVKYLLTYMIFNTLFAVSPWNVDSPLNFLFPQLIYWYLLCLCFWRVAVGVFSNIRFVVPLSILFTFYIGTCPKADRFMSISRAVCFFSFFLIGYKFSLEWLKKIKKKHMAIALAFSIVVVLVLHYQKLIPVKMYEYIQSYSATKVSNVAGIEMRVVMIALALVMTFCLIGLMPSKEFFFTILGRNSLCIYLIHIFVIKALAQSKVLSFSSVFGNVSAAFVLSVIICYVLSLQVINAAYNRLADKLANALIVSKDLYISPT
ncbi:MAG: acyltransferase family protein [Butyrivibrio sp.]|uniref:acyltransferase family protein n=1 Tax=Butyrivibrio sp. TaxID=28121 RepID=UPI001B0B7F08|nr:acyltransferase family protein [Butyrivibrio sp.]MBO6240409.1 acyltransferase family protein [Butyrivibrio sp.]